MEAGGDSLESHSAFRNYSHWQTLKNDPGLVLTPRKETFQPTAQARSGRPIIALCLPRLTTACSAKPQVSGCASTVRACTAACAWGWLCWQVGWNRGGAVRSNGGSQKEEAESEGGRDLWRCGTQSPPRRKSHLAIGWMGLQLRSGLWRGAQGHPGGCVLRAKRRRPGSGPPAWPRRRSAPTDYPTPLPFLSFSAYSILSSALAPHRVPRSRVLPAAPPELPSRLVSLLHGQPSPSGHHHLRSKVCCNSFLTGLLTSTLTSSDLVSPVEPG